MNKYFLHNAFYNFNVWLCSIGFRIYQYNDNGRLKKLLLWSQFVIIGKPWKFKNITQSEYDKYRFTKIQYIVWKKLCYLILRFWVYPKYDNYRIKKIMPWLELDSFSVDK